MVVLGTQSKFRAWKWILHTQIDLRKVASTTWTSFTLNVIEANYISALIMVLISWLVACLFTLKYIHTIRPLSTAILQVL